MPPLKGTIGVTYKEKTFSTGYVCELAARQDQVDTFEEKTAGYIVHNIFAQYSFLTGILGHNISVNIENLLNISYRNHLSRIKSILPESGRNFRLAYKLLL